MNNREGLATIGDSAFRLIKKRGRIRQNVSNSKPHHTGRPPLRGGKTKAKKERKQVRGFINNIPGQSVTFFLFLGLTCWKGGGKPGCYVEGCTLYNFSVTFSLPSDKFSGKQFFFPRYTPSRYTYLLLICVSLHGI